MVYCTIHAYASGDPSKIYRPVSDYQQVCGEKGSLTQDYPYLYFYNPLFEINNRFCVKSCPVYENNALKKIECYRNETGQDCTYSATINQNGSFSITRIPTKGDIIGYETTSVLDRVCIPSPAVMTNALKDVMNKFTDKLQQGSFASLTTDVKNVNILLFIRIGSG